MIGTRYEHRTTGIMWEVVSAKRLKCIREAHLPDYQYTTVGNTMSNDYNWPENTWIIISPKERLFTKLYLILKK